MKATDIPLARLVAQHIAGPPLSNAANAVRWMTCVQAQDLPGSRTSIALRTADRTLAGVDDAMNDGSIVRSWPMRGTLHFVAAEDLGWMLSLTSDWMIRSSAKRRIELELTDKEIAKAKAVATKGLSGRRSMSRDDLIEAFDRAGLIKRSEHKYHLISHLGQSGYLCFGPTRNGKQELVLLEEWVVKPRKLTREAALAEWALRYFVSHGPATQKDFAWWTKLAAADVKAAINSVRSQLSVEQIDGVNYFMDPALPDALRDHRKDAAAIHFLPGFDEFVLGYGDRSHFLPALHAQKIVPGNNGMFLATVVHKGQIVGTWKHKGTGAKQTLLSSPFDKALPAAAPKTYARLPK